MARDLDLYGDDFAPMPTNGRARRVAAAAGEEIYRSLTRSLVARHKLAEVESFSHERLRGANRVANTAEQLVSRTSAPMFAEICSDYQEASRSITRQYFLTP